MFVAYDALQLLVLFNFPFPFPSRRCFRTDWQKPFKSVAVVDICDQYRRSFIGRTGKLMSQIRPELRVWEHGMLCTLVIKINDGFKQGHVKSCSPLTENTSPLPPYPWLANLEGWWHFNFCSYTSLCPLIIYTYINTLIQID